MSEKIPRSMVKPCITPLEEYLTDRFFDYRPEIRCIINWKGCLVVARYVRKYFRKDFHHDNKLLRCLDHLARECQVITGIGYTYREVDPVKKQEKEYEILKGISLCWLPRAMKYFTVPKMSCPPASKAQLLAVFIHFLLQILNSEADHIQNDVWYASLQNRLMFLLAVLGDIPFQHTDELLEEFEIVANEAGKLLYSCFVLIQKLPHDTLFSGRMVALVDKFYLLNAKIKYHCIEFSKLLEISVNRNNRIAPIDSLFVVKSLETDLENLTNHHPHLIHGMNDQVQELREELMFVRSFLKDVNLLQHREIDELRECVIQIRDLAHEADYLINSFVAENFPTWYVKIRLPHIIKRFQVIGKTFEQIKIILDLQVQKDSNHKAPSQATATPMAINKNFVGFEKETTQILHELAGECKNLQIICIVGMPGIGKTTLANNLYNNELIVNRFDRRAWCVVSQTYHKRKVLIEILKSLRSMSDKDAILEKEDESTLIQEMYHELIGQRYLIVIDDIWKPDLWKDLSRYFPDDKNGSRILFTTRNQDVAPSDSIIHKPPLLSGDQCWELLKKKLFPSEHCPPQLQNSGKEIAAKCNGLPLLVVLLAGILSEVEREQSAWLKVEMSLDSYTSKPMETVELSYTHLPDHLKLCFLYLGVYPEDSEIPVQKLTWLWIAEGFIRNEEGKSPEHVAQEYPRGLIDRNLVLIKKSKSTGGVRTCSIHDLLREMCLRKAQEENFLTLIKDDLFTTFKKHQRLCVHSTSTTPTYFLPFSMHCRSFFGNSSDTSLSLPQMKLLKVLELYSDPFSTNFWRSYTPQSIYQKIDLQVHLRYLVIDQLKSVQEQMLNNLVNLKFLRVDGFLETTYLPPGLLKMKKLRHLLIRSVAMFGDNCNSSIENKLETLGNILITNIKDYEILKCSPNLHKLKCMGASLAHDFSFFVELQSLGLTTHRDADLHTDYTKVKFPSAIRKLTLKGTCLPWERMSVLLGTLPNLQVLKLFSYACVGQKWATSEGEFQELRFLKLEWLNLVEWSTESEHFPKLEHLVLNGCVKLRNIPIELGESTTLKVIEVYDCSSEASSSAVQIEQELNNYRNIEPKVIIKNERDSEHNKFFKKM